jgi:hypothetical protein
MTENSIRKVYGGKASHIHDEDEWWASCCSCFTVYTHWMGRVAPRASWEVVAKKKVPTPARSETLAVSLVIQYTDTKNRQKEKLNIIFNKRILCLLLLLKVEYCCKAVWRILGVHCTSIFTRTNSDYIKFERYNLIVMHGCHVYNC